MWWTPKKVWMCFLYVIKNDKPAADAASKAFVIIWGLLLGLIGIVCSALKDLL